MHGLRPGAPRREFEQFVTDSADQLLRTVYLMGQGRSHAEHIYAGIKGVARLIKLTSHSRARVRKHDYQPNI